MGSSLLEKFFQFLDTVPYTFETLIGIDFADTFFKFSFQRITPLK
jgi:hypothetical protein